jgi:hypothetical protein
MYPELSDCGTDEVTAIAMASICARLGMFSAPPEVLAPVKKSHPRKERSDGNP